MGTTRNRTAAALVLAVINVEILIKTYGWDVVNPGCLTIGRDAASICQQCCAPSTGAKKSPWAAVAHESPRPTKVPTGSSPQIPLL